MKRGNWTAAFCALLCLLLILPGTRAVAASPCIDVALVLAVDSSTSVSDEEFDLQRGGIAAAFRDPGVIDAISAAGRVAVSIVFWGSEGLPKPQSGWLLVDGKEGAEDFARTVEAMPRLVTGDTGLGAGLQASLAKFASLPACSIRRWSMCLVTGRRRGSTAASAARLRRRRSKNLPPGRTSRSMRSQSRTRSLILPSTIQRMSLPGPTLS